MKKELPVVKRAIAAVDALGLTPEPRVANGGLDANWLVRHGVPTVTFARRPKRSAHDQRVDRSEGIRTRLRTGRALGDDAGIILSLIGLPPTKAVLRMRPGPHST